MGEPVYHVLLEGRTVGPYDRRTIVGMRIKKALTSEHVLIGTDGTRLTVADLIGKPAPQPFNSERSGSFSIVQATFAASLLKVEGPGLAFPRFKGEVQARFQGEVLRLAGRFRRRLGWKEDRVKIVLKNVVHARMRGSQVDLWLRNAPEQRLQHVALELFTPEAAGEFVGWLPDATPFPDPAPPPRTAAASDVAATTLKALLLALGGIAVVVAVLLTVVLFRRVY